ncbi:MAG: flagellar hook capping FlgD N-terminal domain-containing protein [Bacillota bacterium]
MSEIYKTGARYFDIEEPRQVNKELGKDEFLKILVAQFRGQNPLEPLKDTEFIAQMAQFSSLEELQNISAQLDAFQEDSIWSQYLSLLGKEVHGINGQGDFIQGVVTGVNFKEGQFRLAINGQEQEFVSLISVGLRSEPVSEQDPEHPDEIIEAGEAEEEGVEPGDSED